MSHELEMTNAGAGMAYAGEVPWHGLGVKVPADLTPDQIMDAAGLNWEVNKVPLYLERDGEKIDAGITALVRSSDGKILTHVTDKWEPIQNKNAFEFFSEYVMAGDMEMHTAGSLKGGRIVWGLAKVKDSFELKTPQGTDLVESYLLFTNPHRFGQSTDVRFTPIRVVCNNTLTMAIHAKTSQMVKVSHRRKFDANKVKETLGIANRYMQNYKEIAEFLASKRYAKDSLADYFTKVFPKYNGEEGARSRNSDRALEVVVQQPGHEMAAGSWWQAFNAVTYMIDHELGRNPSSRLESAWYGINQKKKVDSLKLAKEFAEAA